MDFHLSDADRKELLEATVIRFRNGEIGPVTLRSEMRKLRFSEDDINEVRDLHIDECAKNMRG